MTDTPAKTALTFPCDFVIKVFGLATETFLQEVLTLVRIHQPDLHEDAIAIRPSKDKKYLALSITVHVDSQAELDAIYRELTADPLILMAL